MKNLSSILSKFFRLIVRFYQICISPLFPPCCRFYPSCSAYSLEALEKYGPYKGAYLSIKRIVKCNPFSKGGYDPVPEKNIIIRKS